MSIFWAIIIYSSFDIKASMSSYQPSHIMQFKCIGIFVTVLLIGIATVAFGQGGGAGGPSGGAVGANAGVPGAAGNSSADFAVAVPVVQRRLRWGPQIRAVQVPQHPEDLPLRQRGHQFRMRPSKQIARRLVSCDAGGTGRNDGR